MLNTNGETAWEWGQKGEGMDTSAHPLGYEKIPKLLKKFAVPSIIAMVVSSLYNIVDQIFIGQGVGYLGNAATNVAYPLTTICMAIALLIGIGSASRFSLCLGGGDKDGARKAAGNALCMMVVLGILYAVLIEIFLDPLLIAFGSTPDVMPYAQSYTRIVAVGMPLLIVTNGMSSLARADGSPGYSMMCMLIGAIVNTILDPIFIFVFHMGVEGAAIATVIGQLFSFTAAVCYIPRFKNIRLSRTFIRLSPRECARTASLGMSHSLNQVVLTFVQIILNNSLTYYGAASIYGQDIPLAACGIVIKTNGILLSVIIGISQGAQPIISYNYGAKLSDRVKRAFRLQTLACLGYSTILWAMVLLFPGLFVAIFTNDPELTEITCWALRIYMSTVLLMGIQISCQQSFIAFGNSKIIGMLSLAAQAINGEECSFTDQGICLIGSFCRSWENQTATWATCGNVPICLNSAEKPFSSGPLKDWNRKATDTRTRIRPDTILGN